MRLAKLLALAVGVGLVACVDQPTVPPEADVQFNVTEAAADRTVLCHKPGSPAEGTLEVATAAVQAHLDHGDVLGACSGTGGVDACTAINDPGYDGQYSFVELENLIFQEGDRLILHFQCGEGALCPWQFDIFVMLSPDFLPLPFDNFYWTTQREDYVLVVLPDCDIGPICTLEAWPEGPVVLQWGSVYGEGNFTWAASCVHDPPNPEH
jgi:hypothetical protein